MLHTAYGPDAVYIQGWFMCYFHGQVAIMPRKVYGHIKEHPYIKCHPTAYSLSNSFWTPPPSENFTVDTHIQPEGSKASSSLLPQENTVKPSSALWISICPRAPKTKE